MKGSTRKTTRTTLSPTDMVEALGNMGVEVARVQGDEVYALCPMHEERVGKPDLKPSWSVNKETGLSHCFSCGYSASFVTLVMDVMKVEFKEATSWVKKNGMTLDIVDLLPSRREAPGAIKKPPRLVPEAVLSGFVEPPEKALQSRLVTAESCREYGVLWDREEKGWILPVRWPDGVLMGWQYKASRGRVMLNEPARMRKAGAVFGLDAFRGGRMVVVESPLDAVRLHSEGIKGGVSTFGANISDEQIRIIMEYADMVVLALDNDGPGLKETERLLQRLGRVLPTYAFSYEKVTPLPGKDGKDPGELDRASLYRGLAKAHFSVEYR